jgi:hypothetical protein
MSTNHLPPPTVGARGFLGPVLLAVLGLAAPLAAPAAPPPVFSYDFRGARPLVAPLDYAGKDAATFIKPEEGGLRITLPAPREKAEATGIALTEPVSGNFEITVGYELLPTDKPQPASWTGLEVYLMTATPTKEAVGLYRIVSPDKGDGYQCTRMTTIDGQRQYRHQVYEAGGKTGHVRLTRTGGEVTFWAAEGAADDFRDLGRYDLGPDDLKLVRIGAHSGRRTEPVDLRIVDLKVRSEQPITGPVPAFDPSAPPTTASPGLRKGWLIAGGLVGLLVALSLLGTWLYVRRSRPAGARTPSLPAPDEREGPEATVPPISLPCPRCGKKLKVRPEFAGKRVKCPHCHDPVLVPKPEAGDSERITS